MDMTTIGGRLDKAMQDSRVESQAQLSRLSGVPQPTINRILKGLGKKGPESATLIALADALGVELLWLQQGRGPERPGSKKLGNDATHVSGKTTLRIIDSEVSPKLQWVTEREAELLSQFRACDEPQKRSLLAAARGLPKAVAPAVTVDKA